MAVELLGEIGAPEQCTERRQGVAGSLVVGRQVAQPSQLLDTFGGHRLQSRRPRRVYRGRLTGQVGLGQHHGQQRVPEPDAFGPDDDDAGVDGLADRPRIREAELPGDALECSEVGRATADCQDPGHLSRLARHSSPGVHKCLAQLVGQVGWKFVGIEVAAPHQELAEVRVAPRPLIDLLHQARRRGAAQQGGDLVGSGLLVQAGQHELVDARKPAQVAQPVLEVVTDGGFVPVRRHQR
jgi:hypothetical protein